MEVVEESFDATVFSNNREREVVWLFFEVVVRQAQEGG
jgi:hypothetical protein